MSDEEFTPEQLAFLRSLPQGEPLTDEQVEYAKTLFTFGPTVEFTNLPLTFPQF